MSYNETIRNRTYRFDDLKTLLAKASPLRSGDQLAQLARAGYERKQSFCGTPFFPNQALVPFCLDVLQRP